MTTASSHFSSCAMVLGAGFGSRLKPLTDTCPKPLLPLIFPDGNKKPLISIVMEQLKLAGIKECVVNSHHLPDAIQQYLQEQTILPAKVSFEPEILETGGGVLNVLQNFDNKPFFVSSADIWWSGEVFQALKSYWNEETMDALLVIVKKEDAIGYEGIGDYDIVPSVNAAHQLIHRKDNPTVPYVFSGIQILHPRVFSGKTIHKFPLIDIYNKAQENKRLFGIVHRGPWADLGTHASFKKVQDYLLDLETSSR